MSMLCYALQILISMLRSASRHVEHCILCAMLCGNQHCLMLYCAVLWNFALSHAVLCLATPCDIPYTVGYAM